MARRRRLELPEGAAADAARETAPETKAVPPGVARTRTLGGAAPVSRVAGEAAAEAALAEVAGELSAARAEGRMVIRVPLEAVDAGHIARDRQRVDAEETAALEASIAAHGQRTPIEVVETGPGRYGLISGWRRLGALRALAARTGEARFGTALALLRMPEDAGAAYTAMVEENEIRADLGHWERAGIVLRTVEDGVFPDEEAALAALFGSVSRSRRSKIRTFMTLHRRIGDALSHATAMSERMGLALARALDEDPDAAGRMRRAAAGAADADAERAALEGVLAGGAPRPTVAGTGSGAPRGAPPETSSAGSGISDATETASLRMTVRGNRIVLEGSGITPGFQRDLKAWLAARAAS